MEKMLLIAFALLALLAIIFGSLLLHEIKDEPEPTRMAMECHMLLPIKP
jgi:hypothetical protein